jgi:hypothetical protein
MTRDVKSDDERDSPSGTGPFHPALLKLWLVLFWVLAAAALLAPMIISQIESSYVAVLQANADVAQWTIIRNPGDMFSVVKKPRDSVPPDFVPAADLQGLKNRRLFENIQAGEILTRADLLDKRVGISNLIDCGPIKSGPYAMSVSVSADEHVVGTRVDVVQIQAGEPVVVLENVLVLALFLNPSRLDRRATLQLDSHEVTRLVQAGEEGLSVELRSREDDKCR